MNEITKETSVAAVLELCPAARRIFDAHGLRGCGAGPGPAESIEFFAQVHQAELEPLLARLNAEVATPSPQPYVYQETLPDYIYRRFFKAGIITVLTVGCLWGAVNLLQIGQARSFIGFSLLPSIHAHAHAMIYGWIALFVMGFLYQSLPRFKNTTLWRPRLANLSFILLAGGIVVRVAAEMLEAGVAKTALGVWSAVATLTAIALFLLILFKTARQSLEPRQPHEKFMLAAMVCLVLGTILNEVFFFAKLTAAGEGDLVRRIALLAGPLRDLQLIGFAGFIIAGVSQRLLPAVYGLPRPARNRQSLIFWLMVAALALNVVSYVLVLTLRHPAAALGLQVAYTLMPVWAILLVIQLGIFRRAERPDRTLKFVRAAYGWLLVAAAMMPFFLLYGWMTSQRFAHSYMGAHRHAFTVGFISLMIMGVSAKIVPILAGVELKTLSGLWGPFLLVNIGNAARVGFQVATDFVPGVAYPIVGYTGFIEVVGLAWWGAHLWRTMNQARTHRPAQLTAPLPAPAA